jgi:hypothetical protein
MDNNLNLFLIEKKSKKKCNDDEVQNKLIEIKHTLKYCLNFIIKHEDIEEQDYDFIRDELLNFLKSYININIQLSKKGEKYLIIDSIVKNLIDDVLCKIDTKNNKKEFKKEIKLLKKERNKPSNIISISKSQ